MQDAICEGLGPVGERTLLGERIRQRRDRQARPGLHVDAATVASDRFIHLLAAAGGGQGRSGATSFAMLDVLGGAASVRLGDSQQERRIDPEERPLPPLGLDGAHTAPETGLKVADAWAAPVGHWLQLLWVNLLGLGPHLWAELVGSGPRALLRLSGALLSARSADPFRLAGALSRRDAGARIHPSAVVEGCHIGANARIGAGSVVRGCVIGAGAVVEEMVLLEGCVLGAGARMQRKSAAKYSLIEEGAAMAGLAQLGVIGAGAVVKHGAILMDLALGQPVRVRAGGRLVEAPLGLAGVCVGPGAIIGEGIVIAPGRVIPPGLTLIPSADRVLTRLDLPEGCTTARVQNGRLEPIR